MEGYTPVLKGEIIMSKIKSFMNKPFTWGTYLKLSGGVAIGYAVLFAGWMVWLKYQDCKDRKEFYDDVKARRDKANSI